MFLMTGRKLRRPLGDRGWTGRVDDRVKLARRTYPVVDFSAVWPTAYRRDARHEFAGNSGQVFVRIR
jgi:hypothetical protein